MFKLNLTEEGQTLPQISLFRATVQNIGHRILAFAKHSHTVRQSLSTVCKVYVICSDMKKSSPMEGE